MNEKRFSYTVFLAVLMVLFLGSFIIDANQEEQKQKIEIKLSQEQSRVLKCQGLVNQNKLDEALTCAAKLVIDYPKNSAVFSLRGQIYFMKGEYKAALEDVNRAVSLSPKDSTIYFNRGVIYFKLLDYHAAIKDFSDSIKLKPENANVYHWRASAYQLLGKHPEALGDIDKYIELMPKASNGYSKRAKILYELKRTEHALSDCDRAEALDPKNFIAINLKGLIYLMKGEFKKARLEFNKAIQLNPGDNAIYNNRGVCCWLLGKRKEAIEDLKKSIQLSPKFFKSYYHLGYFMHRENDGDKAKTYFLRALALFPRLLQHGEKVIQFTTNPRLKRFASDELAAAKEYLMAAGKILPAGETKVDAKPPQKH